MDFKTLQKEQKEWSDRNFKTHKVDHAFKGIIEEIGEMSHAMLKQEQGIRGTILYHEDKMQDAWADILIYMMEFANNKGWDADGIIELVWSDVKKRDWVKFPGNGITE